MSPVTISLKLLQVPPIICSLGIIRKAFEEIGALDSVRMDPYQGVICFIRWTSR